MVFGPQITLKSAFLRKFSVDLNTKPTLKMENLGQAKVLSAKQNDLNLIPGTHNVEEENSFIEAVL